MATTQAPDHELASTYWAVGLMGGLLALGASFFQGPSAGVGALVGAAMSWASLWTLARAVRNLLAGARVSWALVAVFKFAFLLVLTYWLLESGVIPPLGLALGFGALPLGIFLSSFFLPKGDPHGALSADQHNSRKD